MKLESGGLPVEWLESNLGVFGVGIGIFISVNALFFKSDDFFSKKFTEDVSRELLGVEPPDSTNSWSELFIQLFDGIFKKRPKPSGKQLPEWRLYISLRTFLLSGIASFLAVMIVLVIGLTVGPVLDELSDLIVWPEINWTLIAVPALFPLIFNLVPDYLSLLETRYLLHWLVCWRYNA